MGPRAGPRYGMKPATARDLPRSFARNMSARTGPVNYAVESVPHHDHIRRPRLVSLTVTPLAAPKPASNLPMIITTADSPTGHSEFHKMYQILQTIQTGLRPYTSDIGAMTKGPKPRPSRYTEKAICVRKLDIWRSVEIWLSAAAIMLAVMSVTSCPNDNSTAMISLRYVGQL